MVMMIMMTNQQQQLSSFHFQKQHVLLLLMIMTMMSIMSTTTTTHLFSNSSHSSRKEEDDIIWWWWDNNQQPEQQQIIVMQEKNRNSNDTLVTTTTKPTREEFSTAASFSSSGPKLSVTTKTSKTSVSNYKIIPITTTSSPASTSTSSTTIMNNKRSVFNLQNDYDTIYFFHSRKAGGTSIRRWLERICTKYNLTLHVQEGYVFIPPPSSQKENRTFYITNLRQPIQRIESSYYFEGQRIQKHKHNTSIPIKTIYEWDYENEEQITSWKYKSNGMLWTCTAQCYCKWFGGWTWQKEQLLSLPEEEQLPSNSSSQQQQPPKQKQQKEGILNCSLAQYNLQTYFDFIIITDRLTNDPNYMNSIEQRLNITDIPPIYHLNGRSSISTTTPLTKTRSSTSLRDHNRDNDNPEKEHFTKEHREYFLQKNQYDTELYDYFYNQSLLF